MRASFLRLAASVSSKPLNLKDASATLLPPIPLYRRILRANRHLKPDLRSLGDVYVKSEFRRHQKVTNPLHIIGFLSQWKQYLDEVPAGPEAQNFRGKRLDPTLLEKLSDEQIGQLHEFLKAAQDAYKPVKN